MTAQLHKVSVGRLKMAERSSLKRYEFKVVGYLSAHRGPHAHAWATRVVMDLTATRGLCEDYPAAR